MTTQNLEYYRQRADEELAAARQAEDPAIAQIHRDLARRYRDMLGTEADRAIGNSNTSEPTGGAIAGPGIALG